jgi:hypothetical protein
MPDVIPTPKAADIPFNSPYTVKLSDGEKATVRYEPEQSGSTFYLASLAVSKHPGAIYEVRDDGETTYGPSAIPPTDIDDMTICWTPCQRFQTDLEVIVRNNSGTTHTFHVQPLGYEEVNQ